MLQTANHYMHFYQLDEQAITVCFGNEISTDVHSLVIYVNQALLQQPFAGLTETIPAYCTLTIIYNAVAVKQTCTAGQLASAKVKAHVEQLLAAGNPAQTVRGNVIEIPVCYDTVFAPDLPLLCKANNLSVQQAIQLHTTALFTVYMIGFMPGFPYMGTVPELLQIPRLATPRMQVPVGSVGIAGAQTGIYPFSSPGGWHIIGQTPVKLFNTQKPTPCLLKAGDRVQFYAIDKAMFYHLKKQQV